MSEDEGADSDSSGQESWKNVTRPQCRRRKEARISYSSQTTAMSLQDPMPEYIDPELVKLIAQNAPFELDVFVHSLRHKERTKSWRTKNDSVHKGGALKDIEPEPPLPVEILLSSVREHNDHLSARNRAHQDVWHSCPDRMWSDYNHKDEEFICRAKAVKRKRPKGNGSQLSPADRPFPIGVNLWVSDIKGGSELQGWGHQKPIASGDSSNEGYNPIEDECLPQLKGDVSKGSLAAEPDSIQNDCGELNVRPWRHGMRKGKAPAAKDEKMPPHSTCCKRKAEIGDSQKALEVRKYMETKMLERRKEQQQLKADADAARVAHKEQQRKLDLHRQTMFQSQVQNGRSRERAPKPAWVSEYSSLCEPPQPWSSSSSELHTYLPPPMTPPKLELVPLDPYATQFQYPAGLPSTLREGGIKSQNARSSGKCQSEKVKGCIWDAQRQVRYKKPYTMKEFPHIDVELTKVVNSPITRKAKWKAKTKPRGRKLLTKEFLEVHLSNGDNEADRLNCQQQSDDLEVYKRSLQRLSYKNGWSLHKSSQAKSSTSRVSPKTHIKPVRPPECHAMGEIREHGHSLSKVKRLKQSECFIPCGMKDLSGEELATLLNANRVPSDCESETNAKDNSQVIAEKMMILRASPTSSGASEHEVITDLRKCVGHSFGIPQHTADEHDVLCKWFGPSSECSRDLLVDEDLRQQENRGKMLDNALEPSRTKEVHLKQVPDCKKEKLMNPRMHAATTRKPTSLAVQWQRMQMLKNLAERLVKRVNAACAKKHQIECSIVEHISSLPTDVDTMHSEVLGSAEFGPHEVESRERKPKLDNKPKVSKDLPLTHVESEYIFKNRKFGESELKFFHQHQAKQNSILHCTGLTEQEQVGCETPPIQSFGMELKQNNNTCPTERASMSRVNGLNQPERGPQKDESSAMRGSNTLDKLGTDVTCNNPIAGPNFGACSLSISSSSPVILPTSSKYHFGRSKHVKGISSEETRLQSKKSNWTIPAENDTNSIFHVYTQHLKKREKLTTGAFPHVVQNDFEKMVIDPEIFEPGAQEDMPIIESIPLPQRVEMSKVKPQDVMSLQTGNSTKSSCKKIVSTESVVGTHLDSHKEQQLPLSNFESHQSTLSTVHVDDVRPSHGLNSLTTDDMESAGSNPEVRILEIGDLKLYQAPTFLHLRLNRCDGNSKDTKPVEQKLMDINHILNVKNCTESSSNMWVNSKQEARGPSVNNLIPPMKVTYARQVHSRAMANGGCTDEQVVVELHQMRPDAPAVKWQGDTRLGGQKLDAAKESSQGLECSSPKKTVENPEAEIQEESIAELNTVGKDFKKEHIRDNVTLSPPTDHVLHHYTPVAHEREARSPCTLMTCQNGEFSAQFNHNLKHDPQAAVQDSQEWELKLRRDKLEAELQKLDAEILKTKARLHQHHSVIDNQGYTLSSSPKNSIGGSFKLDKPSGIQRTSTNNLAKKQNVLCKQNSAIQVQEHACASHLSPKSQRGEEKTITISNSYSDSFVSEDKEMEQKVVTRLGTHDSLTAHQSSQSHVDAQSPAQSDYKASITQDGFGSEGSEMSTGRGPGKRLDMQAPRVDSKQSLTAWHRIISKARSRRSVLPNQVDALSSDKVQSCAKYEDNMLKIHTSLIKDCELLDVVQDNSMHTTTQNNGWKGQPTSADNNTHKIEGVVTRNEIQTPIQPNLRIALGRKNLHELPENTTRENHCSIIQHTSQNTETSNNPMAWGPKNVRLAGMAKVDNSNRKPTAYIPEDGWPMTGNQQANAVACNNFKEALLCSIESEQPEVTAVVPSTILIQSSLWTTSENGSAGVPVPGREVAKEGQINQEEALVVKETKLLGHPMSAKALVAAEDSLSIVAAAQELHLVGDSNDYNISDVSTSMHRCASEKPSPSQMKNPEQTFFECNTGLASEVKGQTESTSQIESTINGEKVPTCSHGKGQMSVDEAIVSQFGHSVSFISAHNANYSSMTSQKADNWECLSLPSHMDFSTIKEKLTNNKLAFDHLRPFSGRSDYQDESINSSSVFEEKGGGSSRVDMVANHEEITPSNVSHNVTQFCHKNPAGANKEIHFCQLPSHSENTINSKIGPNYNFSDAQGLIIPHISSGKDLSGFLPSLYFQQEMRNNNNQSEELESNISENLENYQSDAEELQDGVVSSGCQIETTLTRKATLPFIWSNDVASDVASCASLVNAEGEVIRSLQGVKAMVNEDDTYLQKITTLPENHYCGFEVSHGSHFQSESISEEVWSIDNETPTSNHSGQREVNTHGFHPIELSKREQSNKDVQNKCVDDAGKHFVWNAMVWSSTTLEPPDFIETANTIQELPSVLSTSHLRIPEDSEKASCAEDNQALEALLEDEKHLLKCISQTKMEAASDKLLHAEGSVNASNGGSISSPGEIAQTTKSVLYCEPSDPKFVCTLDVARVETSSTLRMQKKVDHQVSDLLSHQTGSIEGYDTKVLADDVVPKEGNCSKEKPLAKDLEDTQQLFGKIQKVSDHFTTADISLDNKNATINTLSKEENETPVAVSSHSIDGYSWPEIQKLPGQGKPGVVVSIPVFDCTNSKSNTPTFSAKDNSSLDLLAVPTENQQLPIECRIASVELERSTNSIYNDHGGPTTSACQSMPPDRIIDLHKTKANHNSQNISLRPSQIITLQACCANKHSSQLNSTPPLLATPHLETCLDKCVVGNQAYNNSHCQQVNYGFDCTNTNTEGHINDEENCPVGSLPLQMHLGPSQHGSIMSESPTNSGKSKKEFCLHLPEKFVHKESSVKQEHDFPGAADFEELRRLNTCSSNMVLLDSSHQKMDLEEIKDLSHFETPEYDVGCLGSKSMSSSHVLNKQQMRSTTCTTVLPESSCCLSTGSHDGPPKMSSELMQNRRIQVDTRRAKKQNTLTDLLTSMIYEDLLRVELFGFHQVVERATFLTAPPVVSETAKVTKTFNPKVKSRSRKVSEFCQVLRHFLPIGWRAASIRHKTGLFLHVQGLRPHPLNPATHAMPGTLKQSIQCPCYGHSEHGPKTTTQGLSLDSSSLRSYVQRLLEVSSLIQDARSPMLYNPKMPIVECVFSASNTFEDLRWQIHEKLILDLINEVLLKWHATKLLVPFVGMAPLSLPAGGEDLVQFVTDEFLAHERYASKHEFDIEKVIAKAFEDEHWEKSYEEARDVVCELAHGILGDLIERFVYEMIQGCCYYIRQCHVLAT